MLPILTPTPTHFTRFFIQFPAVEWEFFRKIAIFVLGEVGDNGRGLGSLFKVGRKTGYLSLRYTKNGTVFVLYITIGGQAEEGFACKMIPKKRCTMKKSIYQSALLLLALVLSSCSAAFYAQSNGASNDLYAIHNRTEIARKQQAEAEARRAEAEARKAEYEAMLAEREAQQLSAQASAASSSVNYQSVLADDYDSAYARRLRGFESASYRMPSSYTNARYSSTFHYVSAYDPAFYNIIVMGDEVWVEPKYVTAMFGSWGRPVYQSAWYYGWAMPSFSIGFGSWGWNLGLSWYDPWYFPSWHNAWYGWYGPHWWGHGPHHPHWHPGWHGGGYRPGYGGHYRPHGHGVVHRPSASRYTRPYGGSSRNAVNRAQQGNRNWSSGAYQGSGSGNRNNSGTVSRQPNQNQNRNSYNSNSNWGTNNSTRRSSSSGYSGSSSSFGGSRSSGSSGSSSSSGSRGGYSGSSSRGR